MTAPLLPELDEPPRGPVVDHDDLELTDDDIDEGNLLSELIDVDDDDDNGGAFL